MIYQVRFHFHNFA